VVVNARNCAANVKTDIRDNFEVQGLVKPGTGADILVNSANNDIMNLSNRDVLIFCGGANDVGKKNSTKALQHIMDFIKTNNHTNIILVNVPDR
jgi:Ca2+-binding RTX toxin-like protein